MTSVSASAPSLTYSDNDSRTRIRAVAGALGAAAVTVAGLLIATPWGDRYSSSADEVITYNRLDAVPDGAWTGMLVNGLALAVLGTSLGLVVCHLVRGRGRAASLLGAVLTSVGGTLSAMGNLSFATLVHFASRIPEEAGRTLVDDANGHTGPLLGATLAGFFVFNVGALTLATALIRARAVPVAFVAAYVLLVVSQVAPLPGRALDLLQIAMMAFYVALAVIVLRRPTT